MRKSTYLFSMLAAALLSVSTATARTSEDKAPEAVLERANQAEEVLNLRGVGYPTTESEAYTAFAAVIAEARAYENATKDYVAALETAETAYKSATEGIQMPEAGKYYNLVMMTQTGAQWLLSPSAEDVSLVAFDGTPSAATAFECRANADGTYSFLSPQNKWFRNHSKYAGVSWLSGCSVTGLDDTYNELYCNITVARMGKDDKTDAELDELFGYMTLFSCRGFDSGKSSYAIGYTVIKADGTDYDGAANLYYNATHTVAVRFVEVEPAGGEGTEKNTFVYTEVSPENNSTVETLSKIRMTYPVLSESVDYEQSIAVINTATGETVTQGTLNWEDYWGGSTVITFTLDAAITAAGTYSITVPEGLIYDDKIIWNDDDTMDDSAATYNPEFTLTYTVTGTATPKNTFNYLSVSPENNSEVESLSKISLTYSVCSESIEYYEPIEVINTATSEKVTDAYLNWEDYNGGSPVVTLTLDAEIITPGTYSITVPEGYIYDNQIIWNDDDTYDDSNATYNPEFTLTYTVTGPAVPPVASLDEFSNTMAYTIKNANGLGTIYYDEAHSGMMWLGASNNYNFSQDVDLTSKNANWLVILFNEQYYLYNAGAGQFVKVNAFAGSVNTSLQDEPIAITIQALGDYKFAFSTSGGTKDWMCASPQISGKPVCQWTVDDGGCAWRLTPNAELDVTAESAAAIEKIAKKTGIRSITSATPAASQVFTLDGRKVAGKLQRGLYIVNGQKVYVK